MKDIKNPRLLWIKCGLFVVLGLIAFSLVVMLSGNLSVVVATSIAIWAFCRAYYFAFYVIEHYIDGRYRFAGLTSLLNYWLGEKFGSIEANAGTVEPFADAIDRKSSRWPAIRCWLLLIEHVFSTSMAAVFSVFITNVAARIILRTDVGTQLLAYPIILGWVVVSPVLNLMINMWSFGSLSWEDGPTIYWIFWGFGAATILMMYLLRRSGVRFPASKCD